MRKALTSGCLLAALAACALLAPHANAAGVLPAKKKLLPKPVVHYAARPKFAPKLAFRAPAPRPTAPRTTGSTIGWK